MVGLGIFGFVSRIRGLEIMNEVVKPYVTIKKLVLTSAVRVNVVFGLLKVSSGR